MIPDLALERRLYRLLVREKELVPMGIAASEARKNLFTLIEQVNDDLQPIEITSKRGDAVLISRADYLALKETAYLLRAPANASRLRESLAQTRRCS
jgi:antitoxin YefM